MLILIDIYFQLMNIPINYTIWNNDKIMPRRYSMKWLEHCGLVSVWLLTGLCENLAPIYRAKLPFVFGLNRLPLLSDKVSAIISKIG